MGIGRLRGSRAIFEGAGGLALLVSIERLGAACRIGDLGPHAFPGGFVGA